jgi:ureidoglycolate lyase
MSIPLKVAPLTREAFRRFGDVLDASGPADAVANAGAARIYRERAQADFAEQGGRISFNVVRTAPQSPPIVIDRMERHPLGAQMFAPLGVVDWLVVAAPAGALDPAAVVAFRVHPGQAVNYRRGVWHSPLIALARESDFLIVERAGEGANLDLEPLAKPFLITSGET